MTTYKECFHWPKNIEQFVREIITERPLLNACAGKSALGDVRIDLVNVSPFVPIDARADYTRLPFKDDSFGAVFMDPPWNFNEMKRCELAVKEAMRVAPILYLMAPWVWGNSKYPMTDAWVRLMPGFCQATLISRYIRRGAEQ